MNFTLRGFKLSETFKGNEMNLEGTPIVGVYTKEIDYYDGGSPQTRLLTVFADVRDGEILETFVSEDSNSLSEKLK